MAPFPAEKARERKKRIGSIGSGARNSRAMNAATRSTPAAIAPTTSRVPQPAEFPRTSPQTIPKAAALISPSPGRSRPVSPPALLDPGEDERDRGQADRDVDPKIHSQAMPSTIAPPTSGPRATEIPVTALKRPIAAPLFSGGKAALRRARPRVSTSAAPAP